MITSILSIFKLPIVRHLVAGMFILGIGFYIGNKSVQKKFRAEQKAKNEIKGQYDQLELSHQALRVRTDTLQKVVIELAKREKIKVDNHISDTKVKDGGTITFIPKTEAIISNTKIKNDSIIKSNQPEKQEKKGFFKRLFGGKD